MDDGRTPADRPETFAPIHRPQRAEIAFARDGSGVTQVVRQYAAYPFHICRPFHLPDDPDGMATLYLQSCSGGIYENDRLDLALAADRETGVHVTSQSATIVHGMKTGSATQNVVISAALGAWVEYLPDPLILFPEADIESELKMEIAADAVIVAADSFLIHDPAGEPGIFRRFGNTISVNDADGRILVLDRFVISGPDLSSADPAGGECARAHGSFLVVDPKGRVGDLLAAVRAALAEATDIYAGASLLPNNAGVLARIVAQDGQSLQAGLDALWLSVRRAAGLGEPPVRRK